jgi:hypothetical protein
MRLMIIVAAAAILALPLLTAHPPGAPGTANAQVLATDFSAAKKAKKPAKKKEENLKAAPSAPPSGGKSTY